MFFKSKLKHEMKFPEISPPDQKENLLDLRRRPDDTQDGNTEAPTSSLSKRYFERFQNFSETFKGNSMILML